jgi:hypothetical protein
VLWFERQVVATLVDGLRPQHRAEVVDWVDESLRALPQHLRAGVAAESLLLGAWATIRDTLGSTRRRSAGARLDPLERSRIGFVRQYLRLLRGLVLVAEHERAPGAAG